LIDLSNVGLSDPTIAELMKGQKQFEADLAKSREIGEATKAQIEAAQHLRDSTAGLMQTIDTVDRKLLTAFGPAVDSFLDRVAKLLGGDDAKIKRDIEEHRQFRPPAPELDLVPRTLDAIKRSWNWLREGGLDEESRQLGLESLFARLENSGDDAVSKAGAVGKFQILPSTAKQYGFDPARLKEPAYNRQVFDAIIGDLSKRYADMGRARHRIPQRPRRRRCILEATRDRCERLCRLWPRDLGVPPSPS
jgi:hypothetical protein